MRILLTVLLFYIVEAQTVHEDMRIDCYPEPDPTKENCEARDCIWEPVVGNNTKNVPECYFDSGTGFAVEKRITQDYWILGAPSSKCPYGDNFQQIKISKNDFGDVLNLRIEPYNLAKQRFEPDIKMVHQHLPASDGFIFEGKNNAGRFFFDVRRRTTNLKIWDTTIGGLLFADKYIQIATFLPSDKMYGLGENVHQQLKHDFSKYKTWSMLARDEPPNSVGEDTKNLYGVHPFYMMLEPDGKSHGVLILNSNAQEVTTGPGPHLVYRTIGGILDIYFFPGPTPSDVVRQYQAFIGKPFMPPFWSLGFQLCRYGYKSIDELKMVVERNLNVGVQLEVVYADIDYMDRYKDFTTGKKWQDLITYPYELKKKNMSVILIFDPAIDVTSSVFKRGLDRRASFIEYPELADVDENNARYRQTNGTKIMLSVVWPDHHTAFPDFFDPEPLTKQWWSSEIGVYHIEVPFDGIWIDMNEPAAFGTNEEHPWYFDNPDHPNITPLNCDRFGDYDHPPFQTSSAYRYNVTHKLISQKTLCMVAKTHRGKEVFYNSKNLYGLYESMATYEAAEKATGKRAVVISRSTFPSSGRYAGHWLGDNSATWDDLRTSIIGVQEFNIFGIPYAGSDICGFKENTTEELCLRWQQMGAFHPFSRNHNNNDANDQDPAVWDTVANATKQALSFRYSYLSYLYSVHYDAAEFGGTVIRPVFFEFPYDNATHNLGYEFLWGDSILIAPVTAAGVTEMEIYLPPETEWYSLRETDKGIESSRGKITVSAKTTELIPVYLRGGKIVPYQNAEMTARVTRTNSVRFIVGLHREDTSDGDYQLTASGTLNWDDGESIIGDFHNHPKCTLQINFSATKDYGYIEIMPTCQNGGVPPKINGAEIYGYSVTPNTGSFAVNGDVIDMSNSKLSYDSDKKIISMNSEVQLRPNKWITFSWNNAESTRTTEPSATSTTSAAPSEKSLSILLLILSFLAFSTRLMS